MSTKRMLINATQREELRVALVDGQWLYDLDIETPGKEQKKGNVYNGTITRVEPSLEAVFIDFGSERHGFLPFREISHEYLAAAGVEELTRNNVKEVLKEGRKILVQVDKEERGTKGAALTTFITLAGCYLVLMPNNPRAGGVSRRIEGDDRAELREVLSALPLPEGMGLIVRTAGVGRNADELKWDLNVLLSQWDAIKKASDNNPAPSLIYQESNVVIRAIRDYLRPEIEEVLIDHPTVFDNVFSHIKMVRPDFINRVKLYQDAIPLFNRYQIESQIESAFRRALQLPSGGSLVIDHTEALVSIDINSARATKGGDIEETALHTNLEAAIEIARQLRLRDLGGLIVIDFIDMVSPRNQRMVENQLREAVNMDRARIQIGRISRFGLLEMSRQRLRPVLGESSRITCPRCEGQGTIRSVEALALIVMRVIEEEAIKDNTGEVRAILPVEVATYLMNEKRLSLINMESRHGIKIVIIPNSHLNTPHYVVERIRTDEVTGRAHEPISYTLAHKPEIRPQETLLVASTKATLNEPVVKTFVPPMPAPTHKAEAPGLIKRLWSGLFGADGNPIEPSSTETQPANRQAAPQRRERQTGASWGQQRQRPGKHPQQTQGQAQGQGQDSRKQQPRRRPGAGPERGPSKFQKGTRPVKGNYPQHGNAPNVPTQTSTSVSSSDLEAAAPLSERTKGTEAPVRQMPPVTQMLSQMPSENLNAHPQPHTISTTVPLQESGTDADTQEGDQTTQGGQATQGHHGSQGVKQGQSGHRRTGNRRMRPHRGGRRPHPHQQHQQQPSQAQSHGDQAESHHDQPNQHGERTVHHEQTHHEQPIQHSERSVHHEQTHHHEQPKPHERHQPHQDREHRHENAHWRDYEATEKEYHSTDRDKEDSE